MSQTLRILIVDDDRTNIVVLKAMLTRFNYQTIIANNGMEAVQKFESESPDMVLMDVMMPVMNGYEATRRIKKLAGEEFIPVIFLTAVTEDNALAECVRCGGDDFITKPYNHIILKSKIDAMVRIKDMNKTIVLQNKELSYHHDRLRQEQEIAEKIFSNIVRSGYRHVPGLQYYMSPIALFNGDLFLYALRPNGYLNILVGDFTGHGLSAAVGAVPVSDLFYAMTSNGFSISDIVVAINNKLFDILPRYLFFAVVVMEIDSVENNVTLWNGGMPDVLICGSDGSVKKRATSKYVPMGILPPLKFDKSTEVINMHPGDRIYVYSDGLTELANSHGVMLGQDGFERMLQQVGNAGGNHQKIVAAIKDYSEGKPQADDITFAEIDISGQRYAMNVEPVNIAVGKYLPMNWSLELKLEKALLASFDPLPFLIKSIFDMQGLQAHKEKIHIILSELISNAVEHGILGLDSKVRETPAGFSSYYEARERLLHNSNPGWLNIHVSHGNESGIGNLVIRIEDSGAGFDYINSTMDLANNDGKSGRGIPLVRAICDRLEYSNGGSMVEAVYSWDSHATITG